MVDDALQLDAADRTMRRWSLDRGIVHTADLPPDVIEALAGDDVDRLIFSATPLQVKDRCITVRVEHPQGRLLVKRHTWGGLGRTLRSVWRTSVSKGCWRVGRRLARLGIPTPRPRACVEQRFGAIGYRSYLMSDYVEGKSLYDFVHGEAPDVETLDDVAQQVARIWTRLVAGGISHNDMKPENFIVEASGRVWLIDLERVRFHMTRRRMKQRQLADVRTFLHPRAWRGQTAARRVFRDAFLKTSHEARLLRTVLSDGDAVSAAASSHDESQRLSVLVLSQDPRGQRGSIIRSIESAKHLADEIVVIDSSAEDLRGDLTMRQGDVQNGGGAGNFRARAVRTTPQLAKHPWVLVLEAGEAVSPLLAIDVEEQICVDDGQDAYRIPIERNAFGQCVGSARGADASPLRLLNQLRCSYSVAGGALAISADPERTGELGGSIEREECADVAEFLRDLNDLSSRAAESRFANQQRARLGRAMFSSLREFFGSYLGEGRYQYGWAGLQLSLLESIGGWLQELKLWQLNREFGAVEPEAIDTLEADDFAIVPGPGSSADPIDPSRAKAA